MRLIYTYPIPHLFVFLYYPTFIVADDILLSLPTMFYIVFYSDFLDSHPSLLVALLWLSYYLHISVFFDSFPNFSTSSSSFFAYL